MINKVLLSSVFSENFKIFLFKNVCTYLYIISFKLQMVKENLDIRLVLLFILNFSNFSPTYSAPSEAMFFSEFAIIFSIL